MWITRQSPVIAAVIAVALAAGSPASAEYANQMTAAQLTALLSDGRTLTLGIPHAGYAGELRLRDDDFGTGWVRFEDDRSVEFSGTWEVRGNQFCRAWTGLSDVSRSICEEWILRSPRSVDIYEQGRKIGVNPW